MTRQEHDAILDALNYESKVARAAWDAASKAFEDIVHSIPEGVSLPDSVYRLQKAAKEQSRAREHFMECLNATSRFVVHGEVPDHLRKHILDAEAEQV